MGVPHLLCCESYHLGSHVGTILGPFGVGLGWFNMVFLVILGLLEFVKNSPINPVTGSVAAIKSVTGSVAAIKNCSVQADL